MGKILSLWIYSLIIYDMIRVFAALHGCIKSSGWNALSCHLSLSCVCRRL